ncbi:MAG: DUF1015 domain-containing protein [Verrucomicrobia bacterium]|nr:DUF1015 domain-containing protein [Verrucomicrobiota bacterium]
MAEVRPFRGLRYNPAKVPIESAATQPYDKITPEMQDAYYEASPHNVVRLVLGRETPDDDVANEAGPNKYTRAAEFMNQWATDGVLVEDAEPAIYASTQIYEVEGHTYHRRGFVALLKLEPFGSGLVYPHERTFKKYKDDRLRLMRATNANHGHIFMLYSEPGRPISRLLERIEERGKPVMSVEALGVRHTMTPITDPGEIETIVRVMADKQLVVADGHHRYETAINYRDEMRQRHGVGGPYDWCMVTMFNMEDKGLVIRPTHRLVRNLDGFDPGALRRKLEVYFTIDECRVGQIGSTIRSSSSDQTRLALYTGGERALVLTLIDRWRLPQAVKQEAPGPVLDLDVTVLHGLILDYVLGLSREQQGQVGNLWYVATISEGVEGVRSGEYQAAFFLNPTRIGQVRAVALSGNVMPQKSTDFYPKLLTGLVMRRITE